MTLCIFFRSPFGYAFGLHYFIIRLVENKELFSKTKDMQDDSATLIQTLNDCGATTWAIMQDAMDMLNQLKDLGTIEEMKKIQEKLRNENWFDAFQGIKRLLVFSDMLNKTKYFGIIFSAYWKRNYFESF